uniref:PAS domain-containing sensor histidine kinase n=1 Tax=uncultured Methylobacterium sp. TaxID=157278 RepID=UPI0025916FE8
MGGHTSQPVWPSGRGEMAGRIRAHDWGPTALGPIEGWSPRLKLMVEQILANPLIACLVCGPERSLIYNDAAAALCGGCHPAALGQPLPQAFPVGWATVEPFYRRAFAGEVVQVHGQPLDTRGEGNPQADIFDAVLTPVREEDGCVAYVHMAGTEFGLRSRAEAAVRRSEEHLATMFGSAAVGLSELAQDGRFLRANDELCRILGRTRDELLRLTILDVTHPGDIAPSLKAVTEAIRTDQPASLDKRYMRPDGSFVWANSRVQTLRQGAGQPSTLLAVTVDLSDRRIAEERLRDREARLQLALDASRMGVWTYDPVANTFGVDARAAEITALEPGDELPASAIWLAAHPDDRALLQARLAAMLDPQGDHWNEVVARFVHPDGAVRWTQARAHPVLGGGEGERWAVRVLGTLLDITEQREIEERLRASEARLQLALDAARLGVWTYDPTTDVFEHDGRVAEISGLTLQGKVAASTVWAAVHPADRAIFQGKLAEVLDPRGDGWNQAEGRFIHPDGTIRWAQARAQAVFAGDGEARQAVRVMGTLLDITDSHRADTALRESETRQRVLVEGVPQLIWRASNWGDWTWSSPQWSAFTGLSVAESRGLGWLEAVHPDDREPVMTAWRATEQSETLTVEHRLRKAGENHFRWFSTRAMPVRDEASGEIVEWLGTSTDVDDLQQLQTRQAVMVAEMQHRTRNLITVIRSIAQQTMAQTGPTERFREQFNERLSTLSRVQGLLSRSDHEPITIRTLVQTELDALGAQAPAGRIHIDGPKVSLRKASVQTFALALHELATNARKYGALANELGELWVSWRISYAEDGERWLMLEWREHAISRPPSLPLRRGYGRELIEKALPYALKARTSYELTDTELRCSIDLPLTEGSQV